MPLYEFECGECKKVFSRMVEKGTKSHPCGGKCAGKGTKIQSACNSNLKGRGFHSVDYPTFDKAVGTDADHKWKIYESRKGEKKRLSEANPGKPIEKKSDGSYRAVTI